MKTALIVFCILVAWHFVVDWFFQSEKQAKAKAFRFSSCLFHVLAYTLAFAPVAAVLLFYVLDWPAAAIWTFIIVNCSVHLLIDYGIYVWYKWLWEHEKDQKYFLPVTILDECFHLGILLLTFFALQGT